MIPKKSKTFFFCVIVNADLTRSEPNMLIFAYYSILQFLAFLPIIPPNVLIILLT